jgi:3-dehydroquinate dehydratase / shikimate dehydrogenase
MIIVPITGPSAAEATAQIRSSVRYADLFELRIDLLSQPEIGMHIASTRKPFIATCRPVREGGRFEGAEEERFELLRQAIDAGARFVDLELNAWGAGRQRLASCKGRPQWIVSHHVFDRSPLHVDALYAVMRKTGAGVLKFAYVAEDAWEMRAALRFFALARSDRQRVIAIAMGEAGEASRVLYRVFGGWATFAGSENGSQSAPGQLPASTMKLVFRAHQRTAATKVFGLVGNPVGQSKGIFIHNPLYRRLGRNAIYCRFKVEDLARFMKSFEEVLSGCSVTAPHKQAMMKFLATADPLARALGAVNTVVRRSKGYFGANTDARGALDAIEKELRVGGRRLVVLGAGGAARAVAGEAARRGARVHLANRTAERARKVARALGVKWTAMEDVASLEPEILVNATSVGMWPDLDASPLQEIPRTVRLAFDAIYNPVMTKFLRDAEKQGAIAVTGVEMYARQAVEQIRLFTGRKPEAADVKRLFLAATRDPKPDT